MNQHNSDGSDSDDYEPCWLTARRIMFYGILAACLVGICSAVAGYIVGR